VACLGRGHETVMPIKTERILFKVGENSYAVTLPKGWVMFNGLKYGDKVEIIANDDLIIRAVKESPKDKHKQML